jgi:hypothetical protein
MTLLELDEKIKYKSAGGRKGKKINCRDLLEYKKRFLIFLCLGPLWKSGEICGPFSEKYI